MIEGLKARVPGADVIKFIAASVAYHQKRAAFYAEQAKQMKDAGITGSEDPAYGSTSNDPKRTTLSKAASHSESAQELEFLAQYIVAGETYELSTHDLQRLGKIRNRMFF